MSYADVLGADDKVIRACDDIEVPDFTAPITRCNSEAATSKRPKVKSVSNWLYWERDETPAGDSTQTEFVGEYIRVREEVVARSATISSANPSSELAAATVAAARRASKARLLEAQASMAASANADSADGLRRCSSLDNYLYGQIKSSKAEATLTKRGLCDGLFLIREKVAAKEYSLSVCFKKKITHHRLVKKLNYWVVDGKMHLTACATLDDVVASLSEPTSGKRIVPQLTESCPEPEPSSPLTG